MGGEASQADPSYPKGRDDDVGRQDTVMATHAQTRKGKRRAVAPPPPKRQVPVGGFGRERFRLTLLRRQRRLADLALDELTEHVNWTRDSAVRSGEINFRRPLSDRQATAVAQGDQVRCDVDLNQTGAWRRVWQMTVDAPSEQISTGALSLALKAGLKGLQSSKAAFRYRDKTAREITLDVARRFHVKIGRLPAAGHRIDRLVRHSISPLDLLTLAWRDEHRATGRRFDLSVSRGVIDVTEIRQPAVTLVIRDELLDTTLEQTLARMASAIVVTSTRTVGGRKRKIQVTVVDEARRRRYGHVVRHVNHPGLHSEAAARKYGREQLARLHKPTGTLEFTHPGIPGLDKGDVIRLVIPRVSFDEIMYATSVEHELSAGSYQMTVTCLFHDPWTVDKGKQRAAAKRRQAAQRRNRPGATAATPPKPKRAGRRS
jgi:hypothetical protein